VIISSENLNRTELLDFILLQRAKNN